MTRSRIGLASAALAVSIVLTLLAPTARAAHSGAAASSLHIADSSSVETRTNGRIFGFYPGHGRYSCSGTALDTPGRSIVLTAGHCLRVDRIWARNVVFVPAYDHKARPFGTFVARDLRVMPQWRKFENPDFDVGAIEVAPNQQGALADVVGGRPWVTGRSRFSSFQIFGYPAGALRGEELRSCTTNGLGSDFRANRLPGPPTLPGRCDMAGGASGGAWILDGQYVAGVTSYGYRSRFGRVYSPYFGPGVGNFLSGLP
jgi:V8-like Glu-specific endopeptidase